MERNKIKRNETRQDETKKAWFEVAFVSVFCLLSSSSILIAFLFVPVFDLLSFFLYFDTMRWRTEEADYVFLFASLPLPLPLFLTSLRCYLNQYEYVDSSIRIRITDNNNNNCNTH